MTLEFTRRHSATPRITLFALTKKSIIKTSNNGEENKKGGKRNIDILKLQKLYNFFSFYIKG